MLNLEHIVQLYTLCNVPKSKLVPLMGISDWLTKLWEILLESLVVTYTVAGLSYLAISYSDGDNFLN